MTKKDKKFISFSQAIQEILDDFRFDPKQYDLFANVYSFLAGGEATPGEEKCPPFGFKYGGIWYRPEGQEKKQFYSLQEFHDLLVQVFISNSPALKTSVKFIGRLWALKRALVRGQVSMLASGLRQKWRISDVYNVGIAAWSYPMHTAQTRMKKILSDGKKKCAGIFWIML